MEKSTSGSPWMKMWVEPRQTIRAIINADPNYGFLILSALYGLPIALNIAQNLSLVKALPLWSILIGSVILCTFLGMIGISITAWLFKVTGSWVGGQGSFQTIRAAVAWSNIPSIVVVLTWGVLLFVFKGQALQKEFADTTFIGYQSGVIFLVFLTQTMASIWGFILLLKALGEVQGFSAWRALLNVLIPFVMIVAIVWLAAWVLGGMHQPIK